MSSGAIVAEKYLAVNYISVAQYIFYDTYTEAFIYKKEALYASLSILTIP